MPSVKFTAVADTGDGTSIIKLASNEDGSERLLVLGGDPLDVTDAEIALIGGRYVLEPVEPVEAAPEASSPAATPSASSAQQTPTPTGTTSFSTSSAPSTPAEGS